MSSDGRPQLADVVELSDSWTAQLARIFGGRRAAEGWRMRVSTNQSGSDLLLQFPQALLGPLFWGMFRARTQEEREWRYPTGPSGVSIGGIDPARILVIGDGPAAGCGVRTHQLGIAGHLARYVAARSERGVVVTVAAHPAASARSTLERLDGMDLDGYDSIVLILAATDAFCLTARRSWRRDMTGLVHALKAADRASVFVTSTASLDLARSLSRFARCLMGTHARMLDIETSRICAQSNTPMIHLDAVSELSSRTYSRWGRRIGAHVARSLQDVDPAADNENTATVFRP